VSQLSVPRSTASIETFGFNVPILVDSTLKIIAGHGRVLAAKHLGLREVPTRMVKKLKRPQELRRLPKRLNLDGG
jgi:ParB-like chromosome segregation protein Spo0J